MYIYEITDILFFIKSIKTSNNSFDITEFISFHLQIPDYSVQSFATGFPSTTLPSIHIFLDYLDFGTLFPSLTFPSHMIQSKGN